MLHSVAGQLGGLTRVWRFDRMSLGGLAQDRAGHRVVRRGGNALHSERGAVSPAGDTARAWWRRRTTPPRNAGGGHWPEKPHGGAGPGAAGGVLRDQD